MIASQHGGGAGGGTNGSAVGFSNDERFLYLYLSLMIAVFSIVMALNIQATHPGSPSPVAETEPDSKEGIRTLHGDPVTEIVHYPLALFDGEGLQEEAFENLLFLLNAHDLNAIVRIQGLLSEPEHAYAKALTLQTRLERNKLTPLDVRVEVGFQYGGKSDTTLILYPYQP